MDNLATVSRPEKLKWPEVYSLAALNAAVVISWIAYHEYQPELIKKFGLTDLSGFLVVAKAIILVIIPPLAGWTADTLLRKNGKFFTVFTVGIGATAMIFMVVATIIGAGALSQISDALPIMIVFWLVAMNIFISPANSMIESFAPLQKLPVVMGVLVLTTELLYALEPLIVELVHFFGDTLTFIVGGILIAGTGLLFYKTSSDEVMTRKRELQATEEKKGGLLSYVVIIVAGLQLGLAKALLVEFFPSHISAVFPAQSAYADYITFGLLGFSAVLAFAASRSVARYKPVRVLTISFITLLVGGLSLIISELFALTIVSALVVAASFSFINITGLPFAIGNLSVRHITYGVGIFIGASELFSGLLEYFYH
ncbi:MAG: hypothetical protein WBA74_27345 [Cyclobacteriaceae bacterium]